jgi:hypothetical protein
MPDNSQFKALFTRVLYLSGSPKEGAPDRLRSLLLEQDEGLIIKLRMLMDIG